MIEGLIELLYSNPNIIIVFSIPLVISIPSLLTVVLKKNSDDKLLKRIVSELDSKGFVQLKNPKEVEIVRKAIEAGELSDVEIIGFKVFRREYLDKMVSEMVKKARRLMLTNRNVDLDSLRKVLGVDDLDILAMVVTKL